MSTDAQPNDYGSKRPASPRTGPSAQLGFVALCGFLLFGSGCPKPVPVPTSVVSAQKAERLPDLSGAIAEYQKIIDDCKSGAAPAALRAKDDCGLSVFRLAQLYEQSERYAQAAQTYREVGTLSRDPGKVSRSIFRAADLYAEKLSQTALAIELTRGLIRSHPGEVATEDALRAMVRWRRDDPTLLAELDTVAKGQFKHPSLAGFGWFLGAQLCEDRGQASEAIRRYDELAKRYPKGPLLDDALMHAAKLLRSQKRFGEAAERLERLQRTYVASWFVGHYNLYLLSEGALLLGQIYLEDMRQPARAIAALASFLKRQPTSRLADDALLVMAKAAIRRHNPPALADKAEACRYLEIAKNKYPDSNQRVGLDYLQNQLTCSSLRH